jgi:hypothetical protein
MAFRGFIKLTFAASCAALALLSQPCPGQTCSATVRARVEVDAGNFSLADLLDRVACPGLLGVAGQMRLGSAPLAGSPRVFQGLEIRSLLRDAKERLDGVDHASAITMTMHVPERVTVRRAGSRASCAEIGQGILGSPATGPAAKRSSLDDADCALSGQIPQGAPLEPTKTVWDAARNSWDVTLRCVHPGDCVPFQVRFPGRESIPENVVSDRPGPVIGNRAAGKPLVLPGEAVSLLWDQDGVRVVVQAVCLDPGGIGETVRARLPQSGRILRAVVVGAGELRVSG